VIAVVVRTVRRIGLRPADWLGLAWLALVFLAIVAAPLLAPFSATEFSPEHVLQPPGWPFLLGTDDFGRDVLSRLIHGAAPTLVVAFAGAALGVGLGTFTGLLSAYFLGWVDEVLMRLMDTLMSFPALVLAMLIVVVLSGSATTLAIAIGIVFWPRSARLIRSVAQEIVRRDFIAAAHTRGEGLGYILLRELLPNLAAIMAVDFGLRTTYGILLSASLSYLGLGVAPPTPAWGLMVRDGQQYLQIAPWLVIAPCAAIAIVSITAVLASDRLRRVFSGSDRRVG
jgi:peptide/nickel transport system permease protein